MGADFRGDPASAMLEVLDPEQNATFRDHYLDLPFDLSRRHVHHARRTRSTRSPGRCATAWRSSQLAGYTEEEKLQIAKRYLVPRQIERNGLKKSRIAITDAALRTIIADYTREAGVREPRARDRRRSAARSRAQVAEGTAQRQGRRSAPSEVARAARASARFYAEARRRTRAARRGDRAWRGRRSAATCCSSRRTAMPGNGKLHDHRPARRRHEGVARRRRCRTCAATRASSRPDLGDDWFADARHPRPRARRARSPKDGPSAGITMATALVSLISGPLRARRRRDDRRDHAHRPGAADRRPEGEGARRPAQRASRRVIAPGAQRGATSTTSPSTCGASSTFDFVDRVDEVLDLALE